MAEAEKKEAKESGWKKWGKRLAWTGAGVLTIAGLSGRGLLEPVFRKGNIGGFAGEWVRNSKYTKNFAQGVSNNVDEFNKLNTVKALSDVPKGIEQDAKDLTS